jgi:hypothetical protein
MRRRDFTVLFAVGTTMWPLQALAQQSRKMPRVTIPATLLATADEVIE